MHEYAVTQTILEIVESEAARAGAARVEEITVVIGELSSFTSEAIEFYFQELSRGTMSQGAELKFRKIEARAVCGGCSAQFRPKQAFFVCPGCGSPVHELKQGNEFYLDSIEVA